MPEKVAKIVWDLQGLDPEETMWGYDQEQFANMLREEVCDASDSS